MISTALRRAASTAAMTFVLAPAAAFAADGDAADAAPASASDADQGLSQIVVTATKRETNLQTTPIAISVIDPQIVKDNHVQTLIDLADGTVPSLRIATFEARKSALTVGIRGIVPFDQNQTARDTPVGVYVDDTLKGQGQGPSKQAAQVAAASAALEQYQA